NKMIKTTLFLIGMSLFAVAVGQTKTEKKQIESTVQKYSEAGDQHNVAKLKSVLHDNYRLVWYGGKDAPFIGDKTMFISKIESKEWGGDKRKTTVESIEIFDGFNAVAKVILDGEKAQMRSLYTLIKVEDGWKIVGELVNATFK
ncbi:MAG: nuclear transport factor 2 family protein, partial [Bacteroidota bacterium]